MLWEISTTSRGSWSLFLRAPQRKKERDACPLPPPSWLPLFELLSAAMAGLLGHPCPHP